MAAFLLPTPATGPASLLAARNHAPAPSPVAGTSRDSGGGTFPPSTSIGVAPVLARSSASANASNHFFDHHQHHQHQRTSSVPSSSSSPPSPASFPLPPSLPLGSSLPPHHWDPVKVAVSPFIAPRPSSSSPLTPAHTVAASVGRLEKTRPTSESEPTSSLRHWAPSSSPSSPGVALAAAGFSSSTLSPAKQKTAMLPDSDDGLRVACDRCLLVRERCVPDLHESDRALQEPSNPDEGGPGQRRGGIPSSTGRPPRREPGRPPCAACTLAQVPCEVGLSSPRRSRPHLFDKEKIEMGEIDLPPPKQRSSPLPPPPHSASPLPGSSRPSAPPITGQLLPLSDASAAPPSGSTYDDAVDGRRPLFSPRDETPPLISPLSSTTAVVVAVSSRVSTTSKTMPADGRHPPADDDGDGADVVDPTSWPAQRTALLARVDRLEGELARLREGYQWLKRIAEAGAEEHRREKKRKLSGGPPQQHQVPAPAPPPPRSTSNGSASAGAPAPADWSHPIAQEPVPVPAQYPYAPPPGAAAAPPDLPVQLSVASTPSSTSRSSQLSPSSAVQLPSAHTFGLVTAPLTAPPPAALPTSTTAYRAPRPFSASSSSSATPSSAMANSRPAGGVFSRPLAPAFQPPPQSAKLPSPFPSQPSTAPTFTLPPSTGPLPSALSALPPAPFRRSLLHMDRPPPPPPPAGAVAVRASSPLEMQEALPSQQQRQQKRLHLHATAGPDSATTSPRLIPGAWMAPGSLGSYLPSSQPAVQYPPSPWTSAPLPTPAAAAVPVPPSYQHHLAPPPHQPPTQQRQQQHPHHPRLHQQQHSHHQRRPPSAPSLSSSSSTSAPHFHPYERRESHDHLAPSPHQYSYQQQPPFDLSSSRRRRDSATNAPPPPPYPCERFVDSVQTRALPPQSACGSSGPSPSDKRSSRHPSPGGSPPPLSHHASAPPPPPTTTTMATTTMGIRPVTASSTASSSTADSPAFPPWSVRASGTGTSASSPSSTMSVNSPVPMPKGGSAMAPGTKGSSASAPAPAPPRQKTSQHSIASLLGPASASAGGAVSPPHLYQKGSSIGVGGCTPTRPTGQSAYRLHHRAHSGGYQESSIRDDRSGEEDIELED